MTVDDIALTLQHGLGTKTILHLLSIMGSAEAVYSAGRQELIDRTGLKEDLVKEIARKSAHSQAESELKYMRKHNISGIASTDEEYPALLLECNDYPHVLYAKGDINALHGTMLSVVGTRDSTPYGQRMCDVLIGRLSEIEPQTVIVSGLAFGIDANAHRAALRHGLRTVAVIANSLPEVTPTQHRSLSEEILANGGAIITELHSQTKQNGSFFIPRNRIIAGLSAGTIVVESPYKGGSLDTAEQALGYNRIIMAVPGRAGDKSSAGCNNLIRQQKASMVCYAEDIVRELGWDIETPGIIPQRTKEIIPLNDDEKRIMACFNTGETLDFDTLIVRSRIPAGQLMSILMGMELSGIIRLLPGRLYETTER